MAIEMKHRFNELFTNNLNEVFDFFNNRITNLEESLETYTQKNRQLEDKIIVLSNQCAEFKEELEDFKKVSIIKNLNNQIVEKDIKIKELYSTIKRLHSEEPVEAPIVESVEDPIEESFEEHVEDPIEENSTHYSDVEESEEEVEVSFTEKKIRGKIYYISDDNDREIYIKLDNGDLGDMVGKYNENNRPTFFKNKKN